MVLLVAAVIFLENNLTAFLIVDILIKGYMLIESTEAIATLSLFTSSSPSISFSSDAWTTETREYFVYTHIM